MCLFHSNQNREKPHKCALATFTFIVVLYLMNMRCIKTKGELARKGLWVAPSPPFLPGHPFQQKYLANPRGDTGQSAQ